MSQQYGQPPASGQVAPPGHGPAGYCAPGYPPIPTPPAKKSILLPVLLAGGAGVVVLILVAVAAVVFWPFGGGSECGGPGKTIKPDGAAYSFRVPDCFAEPTTELRASRSSGATFDHSSPVVPAAQADEPGSDLLSVSDYSLGADTDGVGDDEIRGKLDDVVEQLSGTGDAEPVDTTKVAGARTWHYRFAAAGVNVDTYYLFKGDTQLQVLCQWEKADQKDAIADGCAALLDSLTFA